MKYNLMLGGHLAPLLLAAGVFSPVLALALEFSTAEAPSSQSSLSPAPPQVPVNLGTFDIIINAGSGLSSNLPALAAFNRAALQWEAYFSDPITVNITANLGALGTGIIGSTSSVILQGGYDEIRDQVVADALDEADDLVATLLPTAAQFAATLKPGSSLSGNLFATKANLKAMGFTGLDTDFGPNDATLTFSNTFAFDYDNSDGVGPGLLDFETVASHEIGHALGFISAVDAADAGVTSISPYVLDLFRFRNGAASDPSTLAEFTNNARDLVPGQPGIFDDLNHEWLMSTGLNAGDGRQASHWKADELTGNLIGIMDPTLATGVFYGVSFADLRALDLIGYDIIPEASPVVLCAIAGAFFLTRRNRCLAVS
ncbi:MAG: NF038122 family metalloprotease [Luteolibacter sp.]